MRGDDPVLQSGGLPCVWMTAGQLVYRLCDREFDCDHCPLDAALQGRGMLSRPSARATGTARWEFPQDRVYHRSHAWVQVMRGRRVRYGLDAFAVRLLDRMTALVPPPVQSRLKVGGPACWALDAGEFIPLRSPVSGTVSVVNQRISEDPGVLRSWPYQEGWVLEVECDEAPEHRHDLWTAEQHRESVAADLKSVQRRTHFGNGHTDLGPTLEDGGEPTFTARQRLSSEDYLRLLRDLLS